MVSSLRISVLVAAVLIFSAQLAADIAPKPNTVSASLAPRPADIPGDDLAEMGLSTAGILGASGEPDSITDLEGVCVAMAAETVTVHLCPTLLTVHAVFRFEAPDQLDTVLDVGFPETKSFPFEQFVVEVDGSPVAARRTSYTYGSKASLRKLPYARWREFPLAIRKGHARVTVSYTQGLYRLMSDVPRSIVQGISTRYASAQLDEYCVGNGAGYVVRTGALWKGPIGHALFRLRLTGLRDSVNVFFPNQPHTSHENTSEWEYRDWEPQEDFRFILAWSQQDLEAMRSGPAPYDMSGFTAREQLLDRAIRLARSRCCTELDGPDCAAAYPDVAEFKAHVRKATEQGVDQQSRSLAQSLDHFLSQSLYRALVAGMRNEGNNRLLRPHKDDNATWDPEAENGFASYSIASGSSPLDSEVLRNVHLWARAKRTRLLWSVSLACGLLILLALALLWRRGRRQPAR